MAAALVFYADMAISSARVVEGGTEARPWELVIVEGVDPRLAVGQLAALAVAAVELPKGLALQDGVDFATIPGFSASRLRLGDDDELYTRLVELQPRQVVRLKIEFSMRQKAQNSASGRPYIRSEASFSIVELL